MDICFSVVDPVSIFGFSTMTFEENPCAVPLSSMLVCVQKIFVLDISFCNVLSRNFDTEPSELRVGAV